MWVTVSVFLTERGDRGDCRKDDLCTVGGGVVARALGDDDVDLGEVCVNLFDLRGVRSYSCSSYLLPQKGAAGGSLYFTSNGGGVAGAMFAALKLSTIQVACLNLPTMMDDALPD